HRRRGRNGPRLEYVNVVVLVDALDDREALAIRRPLRIEIGPLAVRQSSRGLRGEIEQIHIALSTAAGDKRDLVACRRPVRVSVLLSVSRDACDADVGLAQRKVVVTVAASADAHDRRTGRRGSVYAVGIISVTCS